MIKKLLVLTPAALIACSFAMAPAFAETVIIKKDHHHHHDIHRYHHADRKIIERH